MVCFARSKISSSIPYFIRLKSLHIKRIRSLPDGIPYPEISLQFLSTKKSDFSICYHL
jgi:hypothetical protein